MGVRRPAAGRMRGRTFSLWSAGCVSRGVVARPHGLRADGRRGRSDLGRSERSDLCERAAGLTTQDDHNHCGPIHTKHCGSTGSPLRSFALDRLRSLARESPQSWGRWLDALEKRPLGSWLLPMIGLGAATRYDAAGSVGLAAAAAERRGFYRRARTFAKHASDQATPTGGRPNNQAPPRRRRKATNAWLDPLD